MNLEWKGYIFGYLFGSCVSFILLWKRNKAAKTFKEEAEAFLKEAKVEVQKSKEILNEAIDYFNKANDSRNVAIEYYTQAKELHDSIKKATPGL
jgi:hypothetical protein